MKTSETTRLYLLRHGEVESAWRGKIYGNLEVELSDRGRRDARDCAVRLAEVPLAGILSSGLGRTAYGAARLARGRSVTPAVEPRLREIDRGAWRGRTFAQVDREFGGAWSRWAADPAGQSPPGGESLADLAARVRPALAEWSERFSGHAWAAVAHSWVVRVALCDAFGLDLVHAPRLDVRTGSIHVLERSLEGPWTCLGVNLDHVPEPRSWRGGRRPK